MFEVVPSNDSALVGGFVVRHIPSGRMIGRSFRLDRVQADVLKFELERVYELALQEGVRDAQEAD